MNEHAQQLWEWYRAVIQATPMVDCLPGEHERIPDPPDAIGGPEFDATRTTELYIALETEHPIHGLWPLVVQWCREMNALALRGRELCVAMRETLRPQVLYQDPEWVEHPTVPSPERAREHATDPIRAEVYAMLDSGIDPRIALVVAARWIHQVQAMGEDALAHTERMHDDASHAEWVSRVMALMYVTAGRKPRRAIGDVDVDDDADADADVRVLGSLARAAQQSPPVPGRITAAMRPGSEMLASRVSERMSHALDSVLDRNDDDDASADDATSAGVVIQEIHDAPTWPKTALAVASAAPAVESADRHPTRWIIGGVVAAAAACVALIVMSVTSDPAVGYANPLPLTAEYATCEAEIDAVSPAVERAAPAAASVEPSAAELVTAPERPERARPAAELVSERPARPAHVPPTPRHRRAADIPLLEIEGGVVVRQPGRRDVVIEAHESDTVPPQSRMVELVRAGNAIAIPLASSPNAPWLVAEIGQ